VNRPKNLVEHLRIIRLLLQKQKVALRLGQVLTGFNNKVLK
jgi:hypothetical protein